MSKKKNDTKWVIEQLKEGKALTSMYAWNRRNITRLAATIHRLRNDYGMPIRTTMVQTKDGGRYAVYELTKHKAS